MFSCRHKHTTFPQSDRGGGNMRVICMDCGKTFAYDWNTMRRGVQINTNRNDYSHNQEQVSLDPESNSGLT